MSHEDNAHIQPMPMQRQTAQKTLAATLAGTRKMNFKPLALAILKARTALKVLAAEVGASRTRAPIPAGKAGELVGTVDICGATSDYGAAAAVAGIKAAGLKADPGA